jgi:hypothetical protein
MRSITTDQFVKALGSIPRPGGRQLEFLKAHANAEGRATTTGILAERAGYRSYRAINLHYGKLARRVGEAMGDTEAGITLLMAAAKPKSISNKDWILVMRPEFADAMAEVRWI